MNRHPVPLEFALGEEGKLSRAMKSGSSKPNPSPAVNNSGNNQTVVLQRFATSQRHQETTTPETLMLKLNRNNPPVRSSWVCLSSSVHVPVTPFLHLKQLFYKNKQLDAQSAQLVDS